MTRDILFRGKRTDNGMWKYGSCVEQYGSTQIYLKDGDDEDGLDRYHVNPSTVGQFTGLFDRNGEKIFEGDIVAVKDYNSPIIKNYRVVWFVDCGGFHIFRPKREKMDASWDAKWGEIGYATDLNDLVIRQRMIKVIGNIYDNPELLEVNNDE